MHDWINCKDWHPPNDVPILVAVYDGRPNVNMFFIRIASRLNDVWLDDYNCDVLDPKYGQVTHWQPLPDKPKVL